MSPLPPEHAPPRIARPGPTVRADPSVSEDTIYMVLLRDALINLLAQEILHIKNRFLLGLQHGDSCNKQIKKITISKRTLLAFRYKLYGDFEQ